MTDSPAVPDLLDGSKWRPLRVLMAAMDRDIAALYDAAGIAGFRPRYSPALLELARRGPLTIRQLADAIEVTHSAMSQTVAAMRTAGLVTSSPTDDGRTRAVKLTRKARELLPFVEAEWRATEHSVAELEDEIPYALTRVVRDIEHALVRESWSDRLQRHLTEYLEQGAR